MIVYTVGAIEFTWYGEQLNVQISRLRYFGIDGGLTMIRFPLLIIRAPS